MTWRPDRRLAIHGGLAAAATGLPAWAENAVKRPNLLFILADDLGYADLGCYGRRDYTTPHIDAVGAEGLMLTQAYANSAVCSPTRTALITGRYQQRLAIGLPEPIATAGSGLGLPEGFPTLPAQLRRAGYRTSLIGKWHLGDLPEHGPLKSGYDRFLGIPGGGSDYFTHRYATDGKPNGFDGLWEDDRRADRPGYLTDLLGDRAAQELAEHGRAKLPFFMSLHFNAPHWPWEGPGDEAVSRSLTRLNHPDGGSLETYGRMMRGLDDNVGKVLAALDRAGLAQNTLVVFTSDNGGERWSDVWPLRGQKGDLLEGGIRVPLLIRWPGVIRPAGRSDQVMTTMDWLPTLLAAAGAIPDPAMPPDGENLLPVLAGQAPSRPRKLFWRFRYSEQAAVRDGDWKYLRIGEREFLYDVAADPRERANLKDRQPKVFARLKAEYAAWNVAMLPYPKESSDND